MTQGSSVLLFQLFVSNFFTVYDITEWHSRRLSQHYFFPSKFAARRLSASDDDGSSTFLSNTASLRT